MERFDLVVVGTGSGLDVARWASESGWSVAIVEKDPAGGTCLNRGCIPSKLLIHSADVAETIRKSSTFGIRSRGFDVDFPAIVKRVTDSVDGDSARIRDALRRSDNPRYFEGRGRFVGPKRLAVGDVVLEAPRFLLATGARPRIPPIEGLSGVPYMTSTEALRRTSLPRSMIILGGGYIAAEMAHFYGALGTEITIVQRPDHLLNHGDREIAVAFTEAYRRRGFRVLTGHEAFRVGGDATHVRVSVRSKATAEIVDLEAETLLVAVGLTPNSDTLDLDKVGVPLDPRGYIAVDKFLETPAAGIFALGDAIGRYQLKHAANHEATYAFHNMMNPQDKVAVDYDGMAHAVFGSPQVAAVGATEEELRAQGVDYVVGRYRYRDTAMGHALEDEEGFVKFLAERSTGRIRGCHILGTDASTLIHEVLAAIRGGEGTLRAITGTIHIHPALSEVVDRAAGVAEAALSRS